MNPLEIIRSKTTNEREKEKYNKNTKNLISSTNLNIITKKLSKNKMSNKLKLSNLNHSKKNISIEKKSNKFNVNFHPISSKFVLHNMPNKNSKKDLGHQSSKRHSLGLVQTKTIKYYNKFSIKNKRGSTFKSKNINQNTNTTSLIALEKNIKNVINDIRVKKEKKNKLLKRNKTIAPNKFIDSNIKKKAKEDHWE